MWDADEGPGPRFRRGDPVWIREGLFEGFEGIFDVRLSGGERCRILLKMIHHRFVPIDVESEVVGPISERKI
jgi:hypothetical protein